MLKKAPILLHKLLFMIVKMDSFLISLDSFYEPFAYGNVFSASVFIGIEPISCDVEK